MRPSRLSYRARASVLAARERARAYGGDGDTLAVAVAVDGVRGVLLSGRLGRAGRCQAERKQHAKTSPHRRARASSS